MTADPIERVARVIRDNTGSKAKCGSRVMQQDRLAAAAVINWLIDQGIPIDKLLAGEMVAVPRNPDWSQGLADTKDKAVEP